MEVFFNFSITVNFDEIKLYIIVNPKPIRPPMPQFLRPPEIFSIYFNFITINYIPYLNLKKLIIRYNLFSDNF